MCRCYDRWHLSEFHIQKNKDWNAIEKAMAAAKAEVWIPYPEKQGLKLNPALCRYMLTNVWIPYPEKQGLKPKGALWTYDGTNVWIPYPEKQGLKLISFLRYLQKDQDQAPSSNRTRIETNLTDNYRSSANIPGTIIQQNKDWNKIMMELLISTLIPGTIIQQNKDWNGQVFNLPY